MEELSSTISARRLGEEAAELFRKMPPLYTPEQTCEIALSGHQNTYQGPLEWEEWAKLFRASFFETLAEN